MAEDTRQDKRANFSAITEHNPNGMARTSALGSNKSGASKKLVIKNFKGIVSSISMYITVQLNFFFFDHVVVTHLESVVSC